MKNDKTDMEFTEDASVERIDEEYSDGKSKKTKIRIVPALVCLLLAVIVWFYAMQVDNPDYKYVFEDITVSIDDQQLKELSNRGLTSFTGSDYKVDITVRGKKSIINRYTNNDIIVTADVLKNYTSPGKQTVELKVSLPDGLTLVDTNKTINVFIDENTSVKVPAKVNEKHGGIISKDYEYGALIPQVSEVTVSGPKTKTEQIAYALVTADFSGDTVTSTLTRSDCPIVLVTADGDQISNPQSEYLSFSPNTMNVTFPVYLTKEVPLSVSYKYGYFNDDNLSYSVTPSTVVIKGEPKDIEKIDTVVVGELDEKKIEKDETLTFDLPQSELFTYVDEEITSADVRILNVGTQVVSFNVRNFKLESAPSGYAVTNDYVTVRLRVPDSQISRITSDDVTLVCDLSGFSSDSIAGEHEATVSLADGFDGVWEIGAYTVNVAAENNE